MEKLRIPNYTPDLWHERANSVIMLLFGAQLLFLNNFSEPLCKQAKPVLKTIFDKLRLENDILVVGDKENAISYSLLDKEDGQAEQIKLNVLLLTCAMLYNFE